MIQKTIKEQLKDAMRAKDSVKMLTLRSVLAAFTNELIAKKDNRDEVTDEEAINVIRRLVKQRKDSIEQFNKGGRQDLAQNEEAELKILEAFLPQMMSYEDVKKIALAKKTEMAISDKSKAGMLMGALMKDLKGRADGADVKKAVDELLN